MPNNNDIKMIDQNRIIALIKSSVYNKKIKFSDIKRITYGFDKSASQNDLEDEEIEKSPVFQFIKAYLIAHNIKINGKNLYLDTSENKHFYNRTIKIEYEYDRTVPSCTKEENVELKKILESPTSTAKQKEIAYNRMVEGNIGLVFSYINSYRKFFEKKVGHNEIEDLLQCGIIGLIDAIESYDYSRGSFSTYARKWIHKRVMDEIANNSHGFRIPRYYLSKMNSLEKAIYTFEQHHSREPSVEEIASILNIDLYYAKILMKIRTFKSPESFEELMNSKEDLPDFHDPDLLKFTSDPDSSTKKINSNLVMQHFSKYQEYLIANSSSSGKIENIESSPISGGIYLDEPEPNLESLTTNSDIFNDPYLYVESSSSSLHNDIISVFSSILDNREIYVLTERFGLNGLEPKTLAEVASALRI